MPDESESLGFVCWWSWRSGWMRRTNQVVASLHCSSSFSFLLCIGMFCLFTGILKPVGQPLLWFSVFVGFCGCVSNAPKQTTFFPIRRTLPAGHGWLSFVPRLPVLRAFVILNRVEDVRSLLYDYRHLECSRKNELRGVGGQGVFGTSLMNMKIVFFSFFCCPLLVNTGNAWER